VIAVVSGKGGVGKSLVTSLLAVSMNRLGMKTAILDADITGPSIPKAFGLHEKAVGSELGIYPAVTRTGISVMSLNLLLPNETDPVIWRGPIIAGTVKQFWTDVIWGDVDYMFIDLPPGTGDVPLTVFQSIPWTGSSWSPLLRSCVHDRREGGEYGADDECPRAGPGGEHELLQCPSCGSEH
jgi:Mrp family chromosome partitioning ATPase